MYPRELPTPAGMTRRHFLRHLATASLAVPAIHFADMIELHAQELVRNQKACILLWMGGGPSTLDTWDPKPGADTGGPFQAISTTGDMQICEHLPMMARQMHNLSVIRSMSTREADHGRGRYFMHTGYVPNPTVVHPTFGSVVSYELGRDRDLAIPTFVSVDGASEGPGFLGMTYAPFVVTNSGQVANLQPPDGVNESRFAQRLQMLGLVEENFIAQNRGQAAIDHREVYTQTLELMTSAQMNAFRVDQEPQPVRDRYGTSGFGRGCLMARRLVEAGVPFIEVDFGGWDNHSDIFNTLQNDKLPILDQAMSALIEDLEQRGMLGNVAILWMGEFGRTPRINSDSGRDHWPNSWSVVIGGAGMRGGLAVGATDERGVENTTETYSAEDVYASLCRALGIPLDTTYTSRRGRPMRITNGGEPIPALFA